MRDISFLCMIAADVGCLIGNIIFLETSSLFVHLMILTIEHIAICIGITYCLNRFYPVLPGSYTLDSKECNRWEAHGVIALHGCLYFEPFVPFLFKPTWYRLFGVKIGKNTTIAGRIIDLSLTKLGENVRVGAESLVLAHQIHSDIITIGAVDIGDRVTIGAKSIIFPNVHLEENSTIGAHSLVNKNSVVGTNEVWVGVPARKLTRAS